MKQEPSLKLKTAIALAGALVVLGGLAGAQTQVEPAFNIFSAEQDREIGLRSAEAAERQLPILEDRSIEAYVNRVGQRLAAAAPGPDFDIGSAW